jgi:hypothetical protein
MCPCGWAGSATPFGPRRSTPSRRGGCFARTPHAGTAPSSRQLRRVRGRPGDLATARDDPTDVEASPVAVRWTGLVLLLSTAVVGGVVDLSDEHFMIGFLALVGVGWNAAVLGGSTLLVNSTPLEVRPDTEAIDEVAMGLAARRARRWIAGRARRLRRSLPCVRARGHGNARLLRSVRLAGAGRSASRPARG